MARDQLLGLASDVDRLLAAGATAASGNENLRKRGKTLHDLGEKVLALKPVADAVDKVLQAPAKQIGAAFLDLLNMARQLRTSLSSVGVEGTLTSVPASGPWSTPLHTVDLAPLYACLTESSSGQEEVLKDAIQRKATGDLRLLSPLLDAIEDNYGPISNLVAEKALPTLGVGILPEVESRLKIAEGKISDARRLGLICKLNPDRALELCRHAIKTGSIALRVKALELLPDVSQKDEAEKTGLEWYQDKSAEVRVAAILTLRHGRSNEALDTVLTASSDHSVQVRRAVSVSLAEMPNPETTPRVLLRMQEALEKLDQLKPENEAKLPRGKKTTGKKAAATSKADGAFAKKNELIQAALYWLEIIGNRKGPGREDAARAVLPLLGHQEVSIRDKALGALGGIGAVIEGVIERFIDRLQDQRHYVAAAAGNSLKWMEPALREPAIPTVLELLEKPNLDHTLFNSLVALLPEHVEKHVQRILPILGKNLDSKQYYVRSIVLDVLIEIGPAAGTLAPDLIEAMSTGYAYPYYFDHYFRCLAKIDPEGTRAVPVLIKMIGDRDHDVRWRAVYVLHLYGPRARAAIPAIRALIDREKEGDSHYAEEMVKSIEGAETASPPYRHPPPGRSGPPGARENSI